MSKPIQLRIKLSNGTPIERSFDAETILIGSGSSAALTLNDPDISTLHAVIKSAGDGVYRIVDLGSEAGTTVNGRPVAHEARPLESGDRIALGRVEIQIYFAEFAGRAAAQSPDTSVTAVGPEPKPSISSRTDAAPPRAAQRMQQKAVLAAEIQVEASNEQLVRADRARPRPAPISASDDLNLGLLERPLSAGDQPTAEQHALEIKVLWGDEVLDTCIVRDPRAVVVAGTGQKTADLRVDVPLPVESFTIATNRGNQATILVPAEGRVAVRRENGQIARDVSLAPAEGPFPAKSYDLRLGERVVYSLGTLTVVAQYVRGEAQLGAGGTRDWFFPRIFAIVALLHVFFVVAAFITPNIDGGLSDDLFKNQNAFGQFILKAPEPEKKKKTDLSGLKQGAKAKDDEGKFGKKELPKKDAMASKAGAPRVDPNKREKDRKIAMNAGLLGILKGAAGQGAVSNVLGPGGFGTGVNSALGGLRGSEMGDAGGAGGLGSRGAGAGGGGNGLGIGGLGTHGGGRGAGGSGNVDLGGRGKGTMRVTPGRTIIQGALTKEEIGRVIRQNLPRFKHCYEKQLNSNPNLKGKIAIYFTIAPTGDVAKAETRETTMNDASVEGCAIKVMRSLRFPKPRGGGIVVVTYPFIFAT